MLRAGRGDVEFYMGGACPIFAIALHRLTKFPLAMLVDETQEFHPSAFSEAFPTIAHVFVVTPDGQALDIRGVHDFEDLKALYHDLEQPKIADVTLRELRGYMGGPTKPLCRYDAKEIREAERVAKELLKSLLLTFDQLPEQNQGEVLDHMSLGKAKKTLWKLRQVEPEFVYKQYGLPGVFMDQVKILMDTIEKEGFTVPITVDGIDGWLEGNHRTRAAMSLGLKWIPAYTRES